MKGVQNTKGAWYHAFRQHISTLAFLFVAASVLTVGAFAVRDLRRANDEAQQLYAESVDGLSAIGELQRQTQEARLGMIYALTTTDGNRQVEYADNARLAEWRVTHAVEERKKRAGSLSAAEIIQQLERDWQAYLNVQDELLACILRGSLQQAREQDMREGWPAFDQVLDDLQRLKEQYVEEAERRLAAIQELSSHSRWQVIVLLLVAQFLAAATAWAVHRGKISRALQASELRFRTLSAASPIGIFQTDPAGRCVYTNARWQQIAGQTLEDSLGDGWSRALHPGDREAVLAEWSAVSPEGREFSGEFRFLTPQGEVRWVHARSKAMISPLGIALGDVGTVEDITERKRAEKQLQERTAYLNALIENSPVAVVVADAQHRVKMCNPAFERLFLYRQSEILGEELDQLVSSAETRSEASDFTRRELAGETVHAVTRRCRKDGKLVDVEMYGVPLILNGALIGVFGLYHDITKHKRAEEELQKAKEAAEAASRSKSEFLANMSHEIRTPMNGIIGMTELALDTNLSAEQREYLLMVKTSADNLLRVINDILDFSKVEAGKLSLDPIEFNLRDSLGHTMKTLGLRAHQKGLELVSDVAADVADVLVGDPGRLRQVIVNLIGNSLKFTESGEVAVSVKVESQADDHVALHFCVSDTGIGIPADKQKTIFDAFSQADTSTTRKYGGTGLGLSICARLVEMMGGRIWVESKPGQGSAFHFTANFGLPKVPPREAPRLQTITLEGLPVLVVDDNQTNRRILQQMLSNWRMKPALVDSGASALPVLESAKDVGRAFPLVLLDANMPGMDGFRVAERIKKQPELAGATIMMLTSSGQAGDAARCRELGIAAYLTKPVQESELLNAIVTVLGDSLRTEAPALVTRHSLREARRSLCVLLTEDNPVNQKLAVHLLEKAGHRVTVANNGREAVEALEKVGFKGFDVVLMDVQMPEMDGHEATAAIRARERPLGLHTPIIAMTAHAMKGDRERCLEAGMDGYISKPIRAEDLFEEIERRIPRKAAPAEPPASTAAPEPAPGEVLDRAVLLERVGGDLELLWEMIRLFLEECPRFMAALAEAASRRDPRGLERAAHALKGSVSNFAAAAATAAALRLEQMGRQGDLTQASEALAALERELERLKPFLTGLCQEVPQ